MRKARLAAVRMQAHLPHTNPMSRSESEQFARDFFEMWIREKFVQLQTANLPNTP